MKRLHGFDVNQCIRLDLPFEELQVLLGDEQLLETVGLELMHCSHCGLHQHVGGVVEVYLDADHCIYLVQPCNFCQQGYSLSFIDTTDLPEWQEILLHLLRQQMGLNSLGDE